MAEKNGVTISIEKQKITLNQHKFRSALVNTMVDFITQHEISVNVLKNQIIEDSTGLQQLARDYLIFITEQVDILKTLTNNFSDVYQYKNTKNITNTFIRFPSDYKQFNNFLMDLTLKTEEFSNKMIEILGGKKTKVGYIPISSRKKIENLSSKDMIIYELDSVKDLVKIQGKTNGNWNTRLQASKKKLDELKILNRTEQILNTVSPNAFEGLNKTFDIFLDRYNNNIYKDGKVHLVLWHFGQGKWHGFMSGKLNIGNFSEAYMRCVYQRNLYNTAWRGIIGNQYIYQTSAENFAEALNQNDNSPGLLEQDIKNIAAKAKQAESMGIKPAMEVAYDLINLKNVSQESIKNLIRQKKKQLHQEPVDHILTDITALTIQQAVNQVINNS